MIFETHRLLIRRYTLDDAEDFYRLNSDEIVMKFIRTPKTRKEAFEFLLENIEYYGAFPAYGRWAMIEKSTQQFIGSFMIRPSAIVNDKVELGYAMLVHSWGKGYATESVIGGLQFAFDRLKIPSMIALTQPGNTASQKVLLKCGFTRMGDLNDNGRLVNLFCIENDYQDRNQPSPHHSAIR